MINIKTIGILAVIAWALTRQKSIAAEPEPESKPELPPELLIVLPCNTFLPVPEKEKPVKGESQGEEQGPCEPWQTFGG